jgi:nitrile hydratase accessory protein
MAVALHAKGVFTWAEWAECLGTSIKAEPALSYYEQWLAALEILLERKHALERGERLSRIEDWRQAAHRTPHGQPILLPSARDR